MIDGTYYSGKKNDKKFKDWPMFPIRGTSRERRRCIAKWNKLYDEIKKKSTNINIINNNLDINNGIIKAKLPTLLPKNKLGTDMDIDIKINSNNIITSNNNNNTNNDDDIKTNNDINNEPFINPDRQKMINNNNI